VVLQRSGHHEAGGFKADISILSASSIAEVRTTDKNEPRDEAPKKDDQRRRASQYNNATSTQSRAFSARLEAAISRSHANAHHDGAGAEECSSPFQGNPGGTVAREEAPPKTRKSPSMTRWLRTRGPAGQWQPRTGVSHRGGASIKSRARWTEA